MLLIAAYYTTANHIYMNLILTKYLTLFILAALQCAFAQLKPAEIFSDNMVLQRDAKTLIWGWGQKSKQIKARLGQDVKLGSSDATGYWEIDLGPHPAGGPYYLVLSDDATSVTISGIVFGDVWICAGQSNMAWTMADLKFVQKEINVANNPNIRHTTIDRIMTDTLNENAGCSSWEPALGSAVGKYSVVGYFFAQTIQPLVNVPIGLIASN